jgi:choloylglycine hydrolase
MLPEPKNNMEALTGALSLMRIAQIPFRDPKKDAETEPGLLLSGLLWAMRTAQIPFRNSGKEIDTEIEQMLWRGCQTNWISAADLTNKVYYVQSSYALGMGCVVLKDMNFTEGSAILHLNPHEQKLGGDLAKQFKEWKTPLK